MSLPPEAAQDVGRADAAVMQDIVAGIAGDDLGEGVAGQMIAVVPLTEVVCRYSTSARRELVADARGDAVAPRRHSRPPHRPQL